MIELRHSDVRHFATCNDWLHIQMWLHQLDIISLLYPSVTHWLQVVNRSHGDSIVRETKWTSHANRRNDSAHIHLL